MIHSYLWRSLLLTVQALTCVEQARSQLYCAHRAEDETDIAPLVVGRPKVLRALITMTFLRRVRVADCYCFQAHEAVIHLRLPRETTARLTARHAI